MSITKLQDWLSTAKERNRENRGITKPRQVTPLLRLIENSIPLVPFKDHADTLFEKLSKLKCSQNQNKGKLPAEDMHLLCAIITEIISHAAHHSPKTKRCVDIKAVRDELVKYTSVDHFIVCDLEMTVPPDGCADFIREIIEIGIVVLDKNFEQLDTFETLVRPTKNPTLSTRCTKITGITQAMVDPAPVYIEAHTEMLEFLKPYTASSLFVQYGSGDHYQIIKDCELHDINLGFDVKVCNFKSTISKSGLISRKQRGLAKALSTCGIKRHGDPHRALNDAIDTANLMIHTIQHLKSL